MWIRLGRNKPKSPRKILRGVVAYFRLLAMAGVALTLSPVFLRGAHAAPVTQRNPLPVPCGGTACVSNGGPTQWVTLGAASLSQTAQQMTVSQTTDKAILNWASFDVQKGYTVRFDQPNAQSIALNRIFEGVPSEIRGNLLANGQVYLVNTNGILFGASSQVNLNSLVASTLNISDAVFQNGILSAIGGNPPKAAFEGGGSGAVTVEPGAHLVTQAGGRVMLLGPQVSNAGTITTPDGQIILAAGDKVYIFNSSDPALRGLLVEVGNNDAAAKNTATNTGAVYAPRGNITMMGMAVNQNGLLSATTSINANGSIRLIARSYLEDGSGAQLAFQPNPDKVAMITHTTTGELRLGSGSVTQVLPDSQDTATSVDEQPFLHSKLTLQGKTVVLEDKSLIKAPAGDVSITATTDPDASLQTTVNGSGARVFAAAGSVIDVAGTTDTVLNVARNQVEVELRGNELQDAPLQRDGILRGKTVTIDVNKGTPLISAAALQAAKAGIKRTVEERSAVGGTVTLNSTGDVITQQGSKIDVSGGKVNYQGGFVNTTQLVGADGKVYDIGDAAPDRNYVGILGQYSTTNLKWGQTKTWNTGAGLGHYQQGYTDGADAGTVQITARGMALDGTLTGQAEAGAQQRTPDRAPQGGQLILGSPDIGELPDYMAPDITIAQHKVAQQLDEHSAPLAQTPVTLAAEDLARGGITRAAMYSNGKITLEHGADLRMGPGGTVRLNAADVDVQGSITAPGGSVTMTTTFLIGGVEKAHDAHALTLGADAHIDTHGLWVNDTPTLATAGSGAAFINGGSIALSAKGDLNLAPGSALDAGGGAWLQANGTVKKGNGGNIALATTDTAKASALHIDGAALNADAPGQGGSLSLSANAVRIGDASAPAHDTAYIDELVLAPEFFSQGGFGNYSITALSGDVNITAGTVIAPHAQTRILDAASQTQASGAAMSAFSHLAQLPDAQRAPVNLAFTVNSRTHVGNSKQLSTLQVQEGAQVRTDAGGTIALSSKGGIVIDGVIAAPGGNISAVIPESTSDAYDPRVGIVVGAHGVLDAHGAVLYQPNDQGVLHGQVLNGGRVNVEAKTGFVALNTGSKIDVSAVAAPLDLPVDAQGTLQRTTVSAKAGQVAITAAEGVVLNGGIDAHAAPGVGAQGGSLLLTLTRGNLSNEAVGSQQHYPAQVREIVVQNGGGTVADIDPGTGMPTAGNGQTLIGTDKIAQSGVAQLSLKSDDVIRFDGDVQVSAERGIRLDAPVLATAPHAQVHLDSAYVALGNSNSKLQAANGKDWSGQSLMTPSSGDGTVTVHGNLVDLVGASATRGVGAFQIESAGDIRLTGVYPDNSAHPQLDGALLTDANVTLHAAQVYPSTLTHFTIDAQAPDATVAIRANGADTPVYSAAGEVTIHAAQIEQDGVLKAPFGQIALNASTQLTLGDGSKTSVAGEGLTVPFGKTQNGTDWVYDLGSTQINFPAPPEKKITLNGPAIKVASGAQVDVSGGGELQAYEFIAGPGGSKDILSNPNLFAVIPSLGAQYAPVDPQNTLTIGTALQPGDSVYLAGGGLPAGTYTLLPARYALLPGAFLVKPLTGYQDLTPGQNVAQRNGTPVVAGYATVSGTSLRDARWSGYAVMPGDAAHQFSELHAADADTFYTQRAADLELPPPRLPGDAGQVVIAASGTVDLQGTIRGDHAAGARGAQLDIAAHDIAVVNTPSTPNGDEVQIAAGQLNALNVESVLLGGTRSFDAAGENIDTVAANVRIAEGTTVRAGEVVLTAQEKISIGHAAQIIAQGDGGTSAQPSDAIALKGDGAVVRVSALDQVQVQRSGASGAKGLIEVQSGATLSAGGSITLDTSKDMRLDGDIRVDHGSLSIGANHIGLGAAPADTSGVLLSQTQLTQWHPDELRLTSRDTLDVYGPLNFSANNLGIDAQGVNVHDLAEGQSAQFTADRIRLSNSTGASANVSAAAGAGTLQFDAQRIELGQGDFVLEGIARSELNAHDEVVATGAGQLHTTGDLTVNSARVTGTKHADYTLQTGAGLHLGASGTATAVDRPQDLGAHLALQGQHVDVGTLIDLPSGTVEMMATGASSGDGVTVSKNGTIDVSGETQNFAAATVYTPGGTVRLTAANGSVAVAPGAHVNVSGTPDGGRAGALEVSAVHGALTLDGTVSGTAKTGAAQAEVRIDVAKLDNFTAINDRLNAGGFSGARDFRQRDAGDIQIGGSANVAASNVNIAADQGAIRVVRATDAHGASVAAIDASGERGGTVTLSARDGVTLDGGAVIDAHARGQDASGGTVQLATTQGMLDLRAGSVIDVSAGAGGDAGQVKLRAPRNGNDVNIAALDGTIRGAGDVTAEAFKVVQAPAGGITTTQQNSWKTDTANYMNNAAAIAARLGKSSDAAFHLAPGLEIKSSSGDLKLTNDWDLSGWRFNGTAGVLTLRAAGDVNINGSLSDGFSNATPTAVLQSGPSWSYRIAGGADLSAADPLALQARALLPSGKGNVVLAKDKLIRSGTGDIDIAAGGDVKLVSQKSVIYTAGMPSASVPDFKAITGAYFSDHGGDVRIRAQGDVTAAPSSQLMTDWLRRQGQTNGDGSIKTNTAWWPAFDKFQEGIGALGGGDVTVRAGGNIEHLSVVIPTSGRLPGAAKSLPDASRLEVHGGGDLDVRAGGDIRGGVYFVGWGNGELRAAGTAGGGINPAVSDTVPEPLVLALGDARMHVEAGKDAVIGGAVNPTLLPEGKVQTGVTNRNYFSTYSPTAAIDLESVNGNAKIGSDVLSYYLGNGDSSLATNLIGQGPGADFAFSIYPSTLHAVSFQGDVVNAAQVNLIPAPAGDLQLIAAHDVVSHSNLNLADTDPVLIPSPLDPIASKLDSSTTPFIYPTAHAATPVHDYPQQPDLQPVLIIARDGDVAVDNFYAAKPVLIHAGRDVKDLAMHAQNLRPGDATLIEAGRDIIETAYPGSNGKLLFDNSQVIDVAGPGRVDVTAGRNVDLGASGGIITSGNQHNGALPASGASVNVLAGMKHAADFDTFVRHYVTDTGAYRNQFFEFMSARELPPTLDAFDRLSRSEQQAFVLSVFFDELRASGTAAAQSAVKDYSRGRSAIALLFPEARDGTKSYEGDINLYFSRIYTLSGGDINMLAPGGRVNAGLANPPPNAPDKKPSDLGIVAQGSGSVYTYTSGDFLVNSSRVFTLGGGDIVMWSDHGNIDAGRGAKSAISAPSPTVTTTSDGRVIVEFQGAVTGSGIRAIITDPSVQPGEVDLIAPEGEVNAGDAGIGAAGNLNISAQRVVGAENIQVGGVATGVPVVDTGSFAASLSGVSNISSAASKTSEQALDTVGKADKNTAAPIADEALTFLEVEVLGYGDEKKEEPAK